MLTSWLLHKPQFPLCPLSIWFTILCACTASSVNIWWERHCCGYGEMHICISAIPDLHQNGDFQSLLCRPLRFDKEQIERQVHICCRTVQIWNFWSGSYLLWEIYAGRHYWKRLKNSGLDIWKSHSHWCLSSHTVLKLTCFLDEVVSYFSFRKDYVFTEGAGAKADNALVFEVYSKNRHGTI